MRTEAARAGRDRRQRFVSEVLAQTHWQQWLSGRQHTLGLPLLNLDKMTYCISVKGYLKAAAVARQLISFSGHKLVE